MSTQIEALKRFFSTPGNPVTAQELADFKKHDREGFDELAGAAMAALSNEDPEVGEESVEAPANVGG